MKDSLSSRFARAVGLGVFAAVFAACLGDVEITDGSPAGGASGMSAVAEDSGRVTPGPVESATTAAGSLLENCSAGEVRCDGQWLEHCEAIEGATAAAAWVHVQDCQTAALCREKPGQCLPAACSFNELHCEGAAAQRCSADLTARETIETCADAAHCSLDDGECSAEGRQAPCCLAAPCDAGALRCNGADLQRCRDDRSDRDTIATCATPALCAQTLGNCQSSAESCACVPPACAAGETRCTGTTLERCNADQTAWEFVETCATAALCELGRARQPLACEPEKCQAGQHRCTGGTLEICNADQSGFDPVQDCPGGAAFCDATGGSCRQTPCDVGETRCNGAQIEGCRSDRTGFDPVPNALCPTPQLCVTDSAGKASCLPPTCAVNEFQCAGSQLQRCNAGRTDFANVGPACLRADLCSAARQRCDHCVPSRRECTPDLTSSRTCSSDGNSFGPLTFCPLGCIANTGACQTCSQGQYSCQNGQLSRCDDGFSFTPLGRAADCAGGNRVSCNGNSLVTTPCGALGCNAARSTCNECAPGQRRCADTQRFQSCAADGTFGAAQACGGGLLCAGAGQCACSPGQALCEGDALLVCNASGGLVAGARCSGANGNVLRTCAAGVLTTNTCASAALCAASTGAACPACVDGERSCSAAGQPLMCSGGQLVAAPPCDAGFSCEGAGTCRCPAGELRCSGAELQVCSDDGQSFEAAPACDGATLRTCAGGTPGAVVCASAQLCQASVGSSCASCLETDAPDCLDDLTQTSCVLGEVQAQTCDLTDVCVPGLGCQPIIDLEL